MRHRKKGRKLGTSPAHTKAIKKNLTAALLANDRIKTTMPRAKEIRGQVDRVITWAKRGDVHSRRLAIAKVMAYSPDLLLLDEPTKGLDPFFKRTLGGILRKLTADGTTIFMVSHDIDFCAMYGDTCAMFFDGSITSYGPPAEFFRGNSYYTTSANQLVRRWRPDIITCEEAKDWLEEQL